MNITKKIDKYLGEKIDKSGYHTSVENGKFMNRYGKMYLCDLDKNDQGNGNPIIVTFEKLKNAEKMAKKYKGEVEKTRLGTFRIVK